MTTPTNQPPPSAGQETATVNQSQIDLHVKLIEVLHEHGQGETDEHDGEGICEMVDRIVSERDAALAKLRACWDECNFWKNDDTEEGAVGRYLLTIIGKERP